MRWLTAILLLAGVGQAAVAQSSSAVYRDDVLSIPGGAVFTSDGATFYRDIRLEEDSDGRFRITDLQEADLARVQSVDPEISHTVENRVNVTVQGYKSVSCVDILDPAISREEDNTFRVALGESERRGEVCTLEIQPFETTFRLDSSGLEPGTYTVRVNDVEGQFTLEEQPPFTIE